MKIFTLLSLIFLSSSALNAQVDTELRIYHKLASQAFQMNTTAQNNNAQDYKVTRLEYYLTRITVVYDGGQELAVADDTLALVRTTDGAYTSIQLGNLNVTNVEGVKFHLGVYAPINNADPSLQDPSHPLAPQAPSMHWGWSSGYRFLVYEGEGGSGFSQIFQFHALGNANYYETSITTAGQVFGTNMVIAVDADYTRGMENIDVSAGIIEHGVNANDLTALQNFRDYVFSSSAETITAGIEDVQSNLDWSVYPNPTDSDFSVEISSNLFINQVAVVNPLGQTISVADYTDGQTPTINIEKSGTYFVNLMIDGVVVGTKRVVKQ